MVDTLQPALESLQADFEQSNNILNAFSKAVTAAEQGMESTKEMLSKRGRSSRLGERSLGTKDPGATSAYFILAAFLKTIQHANAQ
ncbi:PTS-dependent dihydroxyacetone kinase, ADP-binding subunit dhaL [Chlamydia abortus]|nr:PTS-dependent dihydroxyacetone kinase, ADP-binding subunit dhaL [Chlamydia abortus]